MPYLQAWHGTLAALRTHDTRRQIKGIVWNPGLGEWLVGLFQISKKSIVNQGGNGTMVVIMAFCAKDPEFEGTLNFLFGFVPYRHHVPQNTYDSLMAALVVKRL